MGQQYIIINVGENPTLILYTYCISRHAEPPNITKQKTLTVVVHCRTGTLMPTSYHHTVIHIVSLSLYIYIY